MCKFECKVTTFSVMPQVRLEKKRCSPLTDNILFITLRPNKQKGHMNWQQLISNKRLGQEYHHPMRHDDRSEFKRDYDRLIFSAPFRRMQNKTQVFPLPGSIFVHNRLTHSLLSLIHI